MLTIQIVGILQLIGLSQINLWHFNLLMKWCYILEDVVGIKFKQTFRIKIKNLWFIFYWVILKKEKNNINNLLKWKNWLIIHTHQDFGPIILFRFQKTLRLRLDVCWIIETKLGTSKWFLAYIPTEKCVHILYWDIFKRNQFKMETWIFKPKIGNSYNQCKLSGILASRIFQI